MRDQSKTRKHASFEPYEAHSPAGEDKGRESASGQAAKPKRSIRDMLKMSGAAYQERQKAMEYQERLKEREILLALNVLPEKERRRLLRMREKILKRNE